ncbi:hypothetical protein [Haladaptatus sp. NG-SE-30]
MHPTTQSFVERIRTQFGIDVDVCEFEKGTSTAADAATAIGCEVELAKNWYEGRVSVAGTGWSTIHVPERGR